MIKNLAIFSISGDDLNNKCKNKQAKDTKYEAWFLSLPYSVESTFVLKKMEQVMDINIITILCA